MDNTPIDVDQIEREKAAAGPRFAETNTIHYFVAGAFNANVRLPAGIDLSKVRVTIDYFSQEEGDALAAIAALHDPEARPDRIGNTHAERESLGIHFEVTVYSPAKGRMDEPCQHPWAERFEAIQQAKADS